MNTRQIITVIGVSLMALAACGPNDSQRAQQLLDEATSAYNAGHYNQAQLLIDSLKSQYPSEVEVRRQALDLGREMQYQASLRNRQYADSMLLVVEAVIDSASNGFTYVKTEYDDQGRYIYNGTEAEKNLRSYLHADVDDHGQVQLIGAYRGAKSSGFTSLRLTAPDGTTCTTEAIAYNDASNYHYTIQGVQYETVTFTEVMSGGVAGFIALHADEALKLTYLGGSSPIDVPLTPADRRAISETQRLADLLKNRLRFMQELQVATNNVLRYEQMKGE